MTISEELLAILRCPRSGQKLRPATPEELATLEHAPQEALATEDGATFYPIEDGFPILLVDRAIKR